MGASFPPALPFPTSVGLLDQTGSPLGGTKQNPILQAGRFVLRPFRSADTTINQGANTICKLQHVSAATLAAADSDGAGSGTVIHGSVSPSALLTTGVASVTFDILGNVFGLRWSRYSSGYNGGTHPISILIDNVAYEVNTNPVVTPETQASQIQTASQFYQLLATDLGDGLHHVEINYLTGLTVNRFYGLLGFVVDEAAGYQEAPQAGRYQAANPIAIATGGTWSTIVPQTFTTPPIFAIAAYIFNNTTAAAITVSQRFNSTNSGVIQQIIVPANGSWIYQPARPVTNPFDFTASATGITVAIEGIY